MLMDAYLLVNRLQSNVSEKGRQRMHSLFYMILVQQSDTLFNHSTRRGLERRCPGFWEDQARASSAGLQMIV
jgi:hypothetical protein